MVLECNRQFHVVNKYIIAFIDSQTDLLGDDIRKKLITNWKEHGGASKLKSVMRKTNGDSPIKRVTSAFLFFCADERPKIINEMKAAAMDSIVVDNTTNEGEIDIKAVTCELGRRWQDFKDNPDPERMAKYQALFAADKKRYEEAKAVKAKHIADKQQQKQQHNEDGSMTKSAATSKKPLTAYHKYCAEQRSKQPNIGMKELGVGWAKIKQNPTELAKYTATVTTTV